MATLAASIIAVAKAAPAVERLLAQVVALYVAWKEQQNLNDEKAKDARNNAAVDAALGGLPKLCGTCPFANYTGRFDSAADATSSIHQSGAGRT